MQYPASAFVVQVIGIHQRAGDLAVNACKRKAATNIRRYASCTGLLNMHRSAFPLGCDHTCWARLGLNFGGKDILHDWDCPVTNGVPMMCSATKDTTVVLSSPIAMGLDDCLEYCGQDELVEVTCLSPSLHFRCCVP